MSHPTPAVLTRRGALLSLALTAAAPVAARLPSTQEHLRALERSSGGRLGVAIKDVSGRLLAGHRADEQFLFCSTFKVILAGAMLARVDRGLARLDELVPITPADLVFHAPAVEKATGAMSLQDLCAAAVALSDNAAANLLLARIGGPPGLTGFFRALGGKTSRLDRWELDLNRRDGPRDTTTPADAARMLGRLLRPDTLSAASRTRLEGWLIDSPTGRRRLRARLPETWRVGDKTGTGPAGETNDLAFIDVPGRGRVIVAAHLEAAGRPPAAREQVLADVGAAIGRSGLIDRAGSF